MLVRLSPRLLTTTSLQLRAASTSTLVDRVKIEGKSLRELVPVYLTLSKYRLSALVALTTAAGYLASPAPVSMFTLSSCMVGTSLCIASANSINQYIEIEHDKKMMRTKNRPLPTDTISPSHALGFGLASGLSGSLMLYSLVNPLTAALGFGNILLYTLAYTPLKRISPINTHVGAVVGAIPPIMGWTAATGAIGAGSMSLAYLLFVWQLPHFYSLSFSLHADYAAAGYKMLVQEEDGNRKVSDAVVFWSKTAFAVPVISVLTGVANPWFLVDGTFLNGYMLLKSMQFQEDKDKESARELFMATLWYLPGMLGLMLWH